MNRPLEQIRPIFDELIESIGLVLTHVPAETSKSASVFFSFILYLKEQTKYRDIAEELLASFFNNAPSHFYRDFGKLSPIQPMAANVSLSMEWLKRKLRWTGVQDTKTADAHRETSASTLLKVMNHLPHLSPDATTQIIDVLQVYLEGCLLRPIGHINKNYMPSNLYNLAVKTKLINTGDPDHTLCHFLTYQKGTENWSAETQVDVYNRAIDHILQWRGKDRMTLAFKWFQQALLMRNSINADCFIPMLDSLLVGLPMGWSAIHEHSSVMNGIYEAIHSLKLSLQQKTDYHNQYVSILRNVWREFEAKECKIIGSVGSTGDIVSLSILQNVVLTVMCAGINKGYYVGRMSQAIDDLISFMPIIRMARSFHNRNDGVFIINILMNLDNHPDLHRHRVVAMNEWIRLVAELNVIDAKQYLLGAIKENWYKNHTDLLQEAYKHLKPK